jgi:hypothetical protein
MKFAAQQPAKPEGARIHTRADCVVAQTVGKGLEWSGGGLNNVP